MRLTVRHETRYSYDHPVEYALQKIRLRPLTSRVQQIDRWDVTVEGGQIETSYSDHYGNHVDLVSTTPGQHELTIKAEGQVSTADTAGVLGPVYGCAPLWHFAEPTALTQPGKGIAALAEIARQGDSVLNSLHALSAAILEAAPYEIGRTNADTTAEAALEIGNGVCQDHANIFVSAARMTGVPARYVSGYLMMNDRVDQDASHAWAEAHIGDLGWVGFDVSNGVSPDERYVRIAVGRDAADAAPISGLRLGAGDESLIVSLQVQQ